VFAGKGLDLVVVDGLGLRIEPVRDDVEPLAGEVDRRAVGQMSAMREAHAQYRVPRRQQGEVRRQVGLRPSVRLHIGVVGAEELPGPVARDVLDDVDLLATAVVALAGQAFSVLVGENGAGRLEHRGRREVLRRDELDGAALALELSLAGGRDLRIRLREIRECHVWKGPFPLDCSVLPRRRTIRRSRYR
jgi:hypothetical protein